MTSGHATSVDDSSVSTDLGSTSPQTAEELESRTRLLRLLDSVIDALVWAISKLGLSTQQQTLRLGHLTMLLSHIRHVRYRPHPICLGVACPLGNHTMGGASCLHSNKGMDHLSTMKRKNVVLVYNLLLEMLEANISSSSSQPSSSPSSESFSDQYQYPEPPAHPDRDQTFADPAPPSEAPQAPPILSSPPFQSLLSAHMDDK